MLKSVKMWQLILNKLKSYMVFSLISKLFGPRSFMGQCNPCDMNFNASELTNLFKSHETGGTAVYNDNALLTQYFLTSIKNKQDWWVFLQTANTTRRKSHVVVALMQPQITPAYSQPALLLELWSHRWFFMLQSVNMCRVYYEWPDWVFIHCVQAPILYIHSRAQMTASNILTFLRWNTKCVLSAQKSFLRTHHMKKLGPAVRAEIWLWSSGWEQTGWVHELQKKFMINILFHNEFFKSAKPDHSYAATAAHSG